MEKHKLAACGIDCNECGHYKITMEQDLNAAVDLIDWYRGMGWIGENESTEAVMKKAPLCRGCWGIMDDCFLSCGCGNCYLRICCKEKQINHCGECDSFPCEHIESFANDGLLHHKSAVENLHTIREHAQD
jgi:hypothetical protein